MASNSSIVRSMSATCRSAAAPRATRLVSVSLRLPTARAVSGESSSACAVNSLYASTAWRASCSRDVSGWSWVIRPWWPALDSQAENLAIGLGLYGTGHAAGSRPSLRNGAVPTLTARSAGWSTASSFGAGEPDDGDGAVGLSLIAGVARLGLRNSLPCLRARVPVELGGGHPLLAAAEFDPDLIWMRGHVVVPPRMMSCSVGGGDHQPRIIAVREPGNGRLALLAGLGPDRRQVQQILALELVPGPPVPAHRDPVEGACHGIRRRHPSAAGAAGKFLEGHHAHPPARQADIVMLAMLMRSSASRTFSARRATTYRWNRGARALRRWC